MARRKFNGARVLETIRRVCSGSPVMPLVMPKLEGAFLRHYLRASRARMAKFSSLFPTDKYTVKTSTFRWRGVQAENCLILPGGRLEEGTVLVIGHHDYCAGVGAEDNGTALGTMVELAGIFQGFPRLAFASFDLEEAGCQGSERFVEAMPAADFAKIAWVICLECLGSGQDVVICDRMSDIVSDADLVTHALEAGRSAGHELPVYGFDNFYSDHGPFARRGARTVEFGSINLAAWKAMTEDERWDQHKACQAGERRQDGSVAHTRFDEPASIKPGNLQIAGESLVELIRRLTA